MGERCTLSILIRYVFWCRDGFVYEIPKLGEVLLLYAPNRGIEEFQEISINLR